jgi:hypothetical protein
VPQAQESANRKRISFQGIFMSVVSYCIYALLDDYLYPKIETDAQSVDPHSAELDSTEEQNVQFNDSSAGQMEDYSFGDDPLRLSPLNDDTPLDTFFSRPLKIHQQQWAVGGTLGFAINPWSLYFNNPRVINRIANYKLMRADLHIKILLNGNQFHYGRAIVSYNPLVNEDNMTVDRLFIDADVVAASQRPHIWLNPTWSEGGEMKLPFFYYKNLADIVAGEWSELGELRSHSLQNLKHANGASDQVTVSVFAWAENVKYSIPTQGEPFSISPQAMEIIPQADEYESKPVSRVAGSVARLMGKLTDVPVIGMYARATEIGATAIGAMATLFGYSSPVNIEYDVYVPRSKDSLANTNMMSDANKLTLDVKQELSIDPRTVGLGSEDELTISNIASRESYLTSVPWTVGRPTETLLWQAQVDPCLRNTTNGEIHMPAVCFAATPFKYWRGSLCFRFQIVASSYHKGRLKVVYDPYGIGTQTAEYNTAYTTIIDISQEKDFCVDVGWGQPTTWRQHLPSQENYGGYANGYIAYSSVSATPSNGTISVYVVNELTVPNSTINNDIEFNVFVKAGPDFEVSVPTDEYMNILSIYPPLPEAESIVEAPPIEEVEPQAMEETGPTHLNTNAELSSLSDPSPMFHFGESVGSFRQVLKRYTRYEALFFPLTNSTRTYEFIRPLYPMQRGFSTTPTSNSLPNVSVTGGIYNAVFMTPIAYVSCAFAAKRGGVRYLYDTTPLVRLDTPVSLQAERNRSWQTPNVLTVSAPTVGAPTSWYKRTSGFNAMAVMTSLVNPMITIEIPYFSLFRFKPAKARDVTTANTDRFQDTHSITVTASSGAGYVESYAAAAEDFTCFWYLGPPIFYNIPVP